MTRKNRRFCSVTGPAWLVLALVVFVLCPAAWAQDAAPEDIVPEGTAPDGVAVEEPVEPAVTAKVEEAPAPPPAGLPREKQPVRVTSDRMVYDEEGGTVSFVDNVTATHDDLTLTADTVTAYFAKGKGKAQGVDQIDRIVAKGSVKAVRDTTVGTCRTLTYTVADGILRMEGDPVLQDGPNTIMGEIIKFYLKDNRSEVVGGKGGQVEAVFTLPEGAEAP